MDGYEPTVAGLKRWINPTDFFADYGLIQASSRLFDPSYEMSGDVFRLQFKIPAGWEVEYIPSIQALNLFTIQGSGTARERSQMLIRYFDASSFQTLSTVNIYKTEDLSIGIKNYMARRYEIGKKERVAPFADQPSWRNARHTVTDVREKEGRTRYYVMAKNPSVETKVYEEVLASVEILP